MANGYTRKLVERHQHRPPFAILSPILNPSPSTSENLFLRWYASWRDKGVKLRGLLILLAFTPLAAVLAALLWFGQVQMPRDIAAQADAVGMELSRQIAASAADPLAANDNLSLNILLAQWNQNPLIAHTSVSTVDNRIVAEAGQRPSRDSLAPGQGRFVASIHLQDVLAGQLQLSLAAQPFTEPAQTLLRHLLWSLVVLSIIALVIAWRVAAAMDRTMRDLGNWYGDSGLPAPGLKRGDELGDLARQLSSRRIIDMPAPILVEIVEDPESEEKPLEEAEDQPELADAEPLSAELPASADHDDASLSAAATASPDQEENEVELGTQDPVPEPVIETQPKVSSAVLAVRLGNQEALRRLPRPRLLKLLGSYREHIQQACEIYQGEQHTLDDGTSLMIFAAENEQDQEELTRALTCGELLRVLGHDLQIEIADTGVSLHLQLAACRTDDVGDPQSETFGQDAECAKMLENIQYSRNLLLLDAALAASEPTRERAVVRKLASQPGVYCVERLLEPYQTVLERQLTSLYTQRRS